MQIMVGKIYHIKHESKGEFDIEVTGTSEKWIDGTIIMGEARKTAHGGIKKAGSCISIFKDSCAVTPIDEIKPNWFKLTEEKQEEPEQEKEEIEKMSEVEKIRVLYDTMRDLLRYFFEEAYSKATQLLGFPESAAEQAIWWYCNDHRGSDGTALHGVFSISEYTPEPNETGVKSGIAMDFYEELADMD